MASLSHTKRLYDTYVVRYAASIGRTVPDFDALSASERAAIPAEAARCKEYMRFGEEVDAVIHRAGGLERNSAILVHEHTPQILIDLGCNDLPMLHTQKHLLNELHDKDRSGVRREYHGLTVPQIKGLAELLERPLAVMDNPDGKDGIVCVLNALDQDDYPLIAAFKPDGLGQHHADWMNSNFIMSVYGRKGFENYLNYALKENRVLYIDHEGIKKLLVQAGLDLPRFSKSHEGILRQTSKVVKPILHPHTPAKAKSAHERSTQEKEEQIMEDQTQVSSSATAPIDPDVVINVYVANLGKCNEGNPVGGWIKLPVTDEKLNTFLTDSVGLCLNKEQAVEIAQRGERIYEDYAIHDYDFEDGLALLGYKPDQHTNINDLNLLAKCMQVAAADGANFDAVKTCVSDESHSLSPLEFANVVAQADEIAFHEFNLPGHMTVSNCTNLQEALGYDLAFSAFGDALATSVGECGTIEGYFDFEAYGRDSEQYFILSDTGYLDATAKPPCFDWYSREELVEDIASQWDFTIAGDYDEAAPQVACDTDTKVHGKEQSVTPSISPADAKDNAARAAALRNGQTSPGRSNPTL